MCFEIITTKRLEQDVQHYIKKKKFKKILDDISEITDELEKGNLIGDYIPELSFNDNSHSVQ